MAKSKIKTIIMVVAILLALALAGGWIAQTVVSKQKGTVQAEASENAKDGMQVDLDNDGNEVQLMSALIAEADYDEYGVSALAESAYTLHATVTPDNVSNKDLTWSLSFANPTSSWANGKTPSTYVSMTSSGTQATLSCNQAFGEPIYVTATSTVDSTKSARCTLQYKQKVTNVSFNVGGLTFYPSTGAYTYDNGMKLAGCRIFPTFGEPLNDSYTITMSKSDVYTVPADDISVKFEFIPTETLSERLATHGYTNAQPLQYVVTANANKTGQIENYLDSVWAEKIAGEPLTASVLNALLDDMHGMDIFTAYHLNCYLGDMTEPAMVYNLELDFSRVPKTIAIDDVTFDRAEITF